MGVVLYAGSSRSRTEQPDRSTWHSFSFGAHYDPANLGLGPLVVHDDDSIVPGGGYPDHAHRDVEIVTWVLAGALVHTDSLGHRSVLGPGTVQVQSAGSGIRHAERADEASGPTRFVQAWLRPDEAGGAPRRHVAEAGVRPGAGLVEVAGGSALPVGVAAARLLVTRLSAGEEVVLPGGARQHVFVATGAVSLTGLPAEETRARAGQGDAWRIEDSPALRLRAAAGSEVLVWDLP